MNQKLTEELQIVGLGLLIVAISMTSLLGFDFREQWILILGATGMVLFSIGYTVSWLKKGTGSFIFWQNLVGYILFLIFILGLYYDYGYWNEYIIYALAITSALGAAHHLAHQIRRYSGNISSILTLSNLLMLASLGFIIVGAFMFNGSENALKLILAGVFLFVAWGITMNREHKKRDVSED